MKKIKTEDFEKVLQVLQEDPDNWVLYEQNLIYTEVYDNENLAFQIPMTWFWNLRLESPKPRKFSMLQKIRIWWGIMQWEKVFYENMA